MNKRPLKIENLQIPYDGYPTYVSSRIIENSVENPNGCLEYGGGNLKHKYGLISLTLSGHRMTVPAHRALWMAVHRDFTLPSSVYVRHKCANPCCVNIEHLGIAQQKDNMQDCSERGRRAKKYLPHTRIRDHSDDKIKAIRASTGKIRQIAEEFGVSVGYVSKIRSGKAKALLA